MVVGIQLDGGAIGLGRAVKVASRAHVSAHQVVLENLRQRFLCQRGIGFELDGQARFVARCLAHAGLQQHLGHLQVMHRLVGMQRDQAAITGQRLAHLAFAEKDLSLRLKVHHDRRAADQFHDFVAQRGGLGDGVAPLDGVEGKVRQDGAILVDGKLFGQQRRPDLESWRSSGSGLGTNPADGTMR